MKIIRFVKNSGAYRPGDCAGFADAEAQRYLDRGDAEPVVRSAPVAPTEDPGSKPAKAKKP